MEDLPEEIRSVCHNTFDELFPAHSKESKDQYSGYIKKLQEKGMEIVPITTEEALRHRALTKQLREETAKKYGLESYLEKLEKKYEPYWHRYQDFTKWYFQ